MPAEKRPASGSDSEGDESTAAKIAKVRILKKYTNRDELSNHEIYKRVGIAERTAYRLLSDKKHVGPGRTGRPHKIDPTAIQRILDYVTEDFTRGSMTWDELRKEFKLDDVSSQSLKRAMTAAGYFKCTACQKSFLRPGDAEMRKEYAKATEPWPEEHWKEIYFASDTHLAINQNQEACSVRREEERFCADCYDQKRKKPSEGFHVWAMVGWNYKGPLVFYEPIFTEPDSEYRLQQEYIDNMLRPHIQPRHVAWTAAGKQFILQEDADIVQSTQLQIGMVSQHMQAIGLAHYHTPPRSPDFSPMDTIWRLLKDKLKNRQCATKPELKVAILEEWELITLQEINDCVTSMPKRMKQSLERNGLQAQS